MPAYIYIRVSTEQQAGREHVSLEAQQAECLKAARAAGFNVAKTYRDVGSARNPEALPEQARMWRAARAGSVVFCHSYDRISRDMAYGAALMKRLTQRDITLRSVTEPLDYSTPAGFHQLMNVFNNAEFSSRNLGLKVSTALEQIRAGGGCVGPAPYGWEIDPDQTGRKLRPAEHEQRVIAFARALHLGTKTMAGVNNLLMQVVPKGRADLLVALELHNDDGTRVTQSLPKAVDYENIADILNSYEVAYRGKREWSKGTVRNIIIHDKHIYEDTQLEIEMSAVTVEQDDDEPPAKKVCRRQDDIPQEDTPTIAALTAQLTEMRNMFQAFMAFANVPTVPLAAPATAPMVVDSAPAAVNPAHVPTRNRVRHRRPNNVAQD